MKKNRPSGIHQQGYMIIFTMIIVFILTGTALVIGGTVSSNYASTKRNTYVDSAISVAEAGVSDTIARLKIDKSFSGYPDTTIGRKEFYNNSIQGKAEYATVVTTDVNNVKTIRSTGYVYADNTASTSEPATNKKVIEVTATAKESVASRRIYTGPGGLSINYGSGPSKGEVSTQGKIKLSLNAAIGSSGEATTVNALNGGCGDSTNYPVACPANDPPLTIDSGSSIRATVCATNQVSALGINSDALNEGLKPGCEAEEVLSPVFDRRKFYDRMNTTSKLADVNSCGYNMGSSANWTANTRYVGTLRAEFNCTATIYGDIYVDGDVNLSANLRVAANIAVAPTIVATGRVNMDGTVIKNNLGIAVKVISFDSTDSACSANPDCVVLDTSSKKLASRDRRTISSTFGRLDGSVLWSYFGELYISGPPPAFSSTSIGAALGQKVSITHLAIIQTNAWTQNAPAAAEMVFIGKYTILSYRQVY